MLDILEQDEESTTDFSKQLRYHFFFQTADYKANYLLFTKIVFFNYVEMFWFCNKKYKLTCGVDKLIF